MLNFEIIVIPCIARHVTNPVIVSREQSVEPVVQTCMQW